MNRRLLIIICVAASLLVGLLIALSIFRSNPQSSEQLSITEVVIPTASPNNQSLSSSIRSNEDVKLGSADTTAVDNTVKKLPIDSEGLKVEFSDLLDTFYIQNTATDEAQLNQFLEENNLLNLYKSHPKFFKFTKQNPKDVMDEDEFKFIGDNDLGETQPEKETEEERKVAPLKDILNSLTTFDFSDPSPTGGVAQQQSAATTAVGSNPINTANCDNIVGNEKIVCAALKYTGIRYGFSSSARGNKQSKDRWGIVSQGQNGHNPAQWIAQRVPGGANDFLECSGYVAVAIYDAFKVVADHCSVYYYGAEHFKKIDINTARAGDLLIKGTSCAGSGGGGHIGIFVKRLPNGRIQTLESTPRGSGRTGYYEVAPTFFTKAVRYTGPGSTP